MIKRKKNPKRTSKTKPQKLSLLNLKVTEAERKLFRREAENHMNGNVSAFVRYLVKTYPKLLQQLGKNTR